MARRPRTDLGAWARKHGWLEQRAAKRLETVDARTAGAGLPAFVVAEFRKFLRCGVLAVGIMKCRTKLADSAFKGIPFDENACVTLAKTKFDGTVAKLAASCPACALANASAFRDGAEAFVDAGSPLAFCAGETPLP